MYIYLYLYTCVYVYMYVCVYVCVFKCICTVTLHWIVGYGVATVSRIDKIIGLFCRISSLL